MAAAPELLRLFDAHGLDPSSQVERGSKSAEKSLRRVAEAARLVAKAQAGFVRAVTTARSAGCSWRRIGSAAGLPYQSLHRAFTTTKRRRNELKRPVVSDLRGLTE